MAEGSEKGLGSSPGSGVDAESRAGGTGYGGLDRSGPNNYEGNNREQFNRNRQITATNPYGNEGFFTRVLGIDPSQISYAGNFSTDPSQDLAIRQGIASNQFDKFANPFRDVGQGPGKLRPGVQQAGYQTALGPVMEQYRQQPMSEMLARGVFGLLGGGLPGIALSQLGTKEYGIEGTPGFDPNNPRGASGILAEIGRVFTGGVDPSSAAAEAAQTGEAIRDFFSSNQPVPSPATTQIQQVAPDMPGREVYADQRDRENALLSGIFGMGTQNPAPQQTNNLQDYMPVQGVAEQDVRSPRPLSTRRDPEGTLYSPTDMYSMLTRQLAPSDLPFTDTSMQSTIERKLAEGMPI